MQKSQNIISFLKEKFSIKQNIFKWKILDTYILLKFLGAFFFAISMLITIIILFDLSENIQRFLDNNIPVKKIIFSYYGNFVPYFINLFIPLFTFISVIWFTSQLSQRNEFVAILNAGIHFYRILIPYFTGACIIALLSFIFSNFLIPKATANLNQFKSEFFSRHSLSYSNIHVKNSPNTYLFMGSWDKDEQKGSQFSYEALDNDEMSKKIKAQTIAYNTDLKYWKLYNCTTREIINGKETIYYEDSIELPLNITPIDLNQDEAVIETMSFKQLNRNIKEGKEKGTVFTRYYIIERHKRIANAFGTIIMTILGLNVASRKNTRGVGIHLFIGMGLAFSFVFLQQISDAFANSGSISPALGTWIPNIIFLITCIGMLRFAQK